MICITDESELLLQDNIRGLYFYATWMPFHKKMNLMIEKVEEKYKNISFIGIDVESFINLRKRFAIDSIPTVLIMVNGEEKKRINGVVMTSAFKNAFVDICS